ncbi:MAG: FG-GAP-like repeat-containing protein [Mariprofundaceae bacterium]|nr:FG-GAP-like repeat-containing protein [Mariprofundaceae bacterium]
MSLDNSKSPLPAFSMHNIGPQHQFESRATRFVDLNQDGHIDLLIGGRDSVDGFHVEWGDGAGHWRMQPGPFTSMQPRSFAVADVDADSTLEILIGGEGDQKGLQIWSLDAASGGWKLHSSPVDGGIYHAVKFSDLNHDGWPDIIAARMGSERDGGIYVLLNDGHGGWQAGTGPMVAGAFTDLAIADMNGDGNADIVASRRGGLGARSDKNDEHWRQVGGVQIWYGDGTSRWEPEVLPADADAESVTVADVNGDGRLDIVAGLYQQGIRLWLGGKSWKKQGVIQQGTWSDLKVGDLDGDGRRELVATSSDGRGVAVWGWRSGSFSSRAKMAPDYGIYFSLDLGDVYNRGQLDIAAVRANGGPEVWSGLKAEPAPKREYAGKAIGAKLSLFFDSGLATIDAASQQEAEAWLSDFDVPPSQIRFEIEGRADIRPIHSDLYPNNAALSLARAESVAAWLLSRGARKEVITIKAVGDADPLPEGDDPAALQKNRRVFVQAHALESVRLPEVVSGKVRDLYHIDENRVFKVIDGIPDYKVGPGDELSMTFWQGGKSEEHKVTVQVDGTVSLPYQEALKVSGLTPREIDNYVTTLLSRYEKRPRVDVQVLKAKSKTVSIFGEVQSLTRQPTGPGRYYMSGKESLVDFLSRAGGPGKDADMSKVQITRDGKTITLNLERAIKQGDWAENAIIDHGDTIFVPSLTQSKRRVYVLGEVGTPGIIEFSGDISFLDAVSKSGGLGKNAYMPDIRVIRSDRDAPQILAVDFERFMERGDLTQNLALQDKDVLIIPRRPIANWNLYVQEIMPSLQLLLQPVNAASQILSVQVLSKSL